MAVTVTATRPMLPSFLHIICGVSGVFNGSPLAGRIKMPYYTPAVLGTIVFFPPACPSAHARYPGGFHGVVNPTSVHTTTRHYGHSQPRCHAQFRATLGHILHNTVASISSWHGPSQRLYNRLHLFLKTHCRLPSCNAIFRFSDIFCLPGAMAFLSIQLPFDSSHADTT